jgi:hypothetical protein
MQSSGVQHGNGFKAGRFGLVEDGYCQGASGGDLGRIKVSADGECGLCASLYALSENPGSAPASKLKNRPQSQHHTSLANPELQALTDLSIPGTGPCAYLR